MTHKAEENTAGTPTPADKKNAPKANWRRRIIETLLFIALFFGIVTWQARHLIPPGEPAPDAQLALFEGGERSLSDLQGKPTLVAFWAPWCGVCKATSGNVSRVQRWLGDRANVVSVAIDYGSLADVANYVEKQGVDYPILLDDGTIAEAYQLRVFPTFYVLDEQGRVKRRVTGYTSTLGLWFRTRF